MKSIFVSSTFRDMHHERDIIHTKAAPVLNALAQKYGESVSVCDLRWGIDTSEMSEKNSTLKVLDVCLNEIDRCPFMIVILGYRYGWMPGEEMISYAVSQKGDISLRDLNISVTALEVEYGTLCQPERIGNTLFYFREIDGIAEEKYRSEDLIHKQKLEQLKQRIQAVPGSHVQVYHVNPERIGESMERFSDMIINDMKNLLVKEWRANAELSEYELDRRKHDERMKELNGRFVSRSSLLKTCLGEQETSHGNLFLYGAAGSGKSTLLSRIGEVLAGRGHKVIPIYCGYTPMCCTSFDIIKYIIWVLEDELRYEKHMSDVIQTADIEIWYEQFHKLLGEYDNKGFPQLIFLIDGIDQLIADDVFQDFQFISDVKEKSVGFILSAISEKKVLSGVPSVKVGMLIPEERREVIKGILSDKHREISDSVAECIAERKQAGLPLYLSLIVQRLMMMTGSEFETISSMGDGIEAIEKFQKKLIEDCPETVEALSVHVLRAASELIGDKNLTIIASLLSISRRGLRMSDLEGLMELLHRQFSPLNTISFVQYMSPAFIYRSDGRIDFAHKNIRQGFINTVGTPVAAHRLIASWLYALDENDEVRVQEICYHLFKADEKMRYANTVADYNYNKINVAGIARDCVSAVFEDNGEWILQVIRKCSDELFFPRFSVMITDIVFFTMANTGRNLLIKKRIGEEFLEICQRKSNANGIFGNIWDTTIACERLISVYRAMETEESLKRALELGYRSLDIRRKLIRQIERLHNIEDIRRYLQLELSSIGVAIKNEVSGEQLREFKEMMMYELIRGIIIGSKDMADIYSDLEDHSNALEFIKTSIIEREKLLKKKNERFQSNSPEYELVSDYIKAAKICVNLKNLETAEHFCYKAITLAETTHTLRPNDDDIIDVYCTSMMTLAVLDGKDTDESINLCLTCMPMLEKLHIKKHSDKSRDSLSKLYYLLSQFYGAKHDADSRRKAEYYSSLSVNMLNNISAENAESIDIVIGKARAEMNKAEHLSRTCSVITPEIIECYRSSFGLLRRRLDELNSEKAYEDIDEVYYSLAKTVKSFDYINEKIRKRAETEINLKVLDIHEQIFHEKNDNYRSMIIARAKAAESIGTLEQISRENIPKELFELLETASIEPQKLLTDNQLRAYSALGAALKMAESLAEETKNTDDYDILIKTLVRYTTLSPVASKNDFYKNVSDLKQLSLMLYRKTKNKDYLEFLALAEALPKIFDV